MESERYGIIGGKWGEALYCKFRLAGFRRVCLWIATVAYITSVCLSVGPFVRGYFEMHVPS